MKIRWCYILLSLVFALLLGLAYLNQAFFYTYLIKPIASILWLVYRTFLSVNQEIYWGLLILITLIFILGVIPNTPELSYRPAYRNSIIERDRVKYWEALLKSAKESEYDRLKLQHELEALNLSIRALLDEKNEKGLLPPPFSNNFWQRVLTAWMSFTFSRIMQRKAKHKVTEFEKYLDINVRSMETQLEIRNDGKSNRNNDN